MVVQKYEILRTRFVGRMQEVMAVPTVQLEVSSGNIKAEFDRVNNTKFDLGTGQTMVAVIMESAFMCSFHHIVVDVTSIELFLQDLDRAYRGENLKPAARQPVDFAHYEHKALHDSTWSESIRFWRNQHQHSMKPLPLIPGSSVNERQRLEDFRLQGIRKDLSRETTTAIKRAADAIKVSPYHYHLTMFRILLAKVLPLRDFCIGAVDAGRASHPEFADVFGPMFNYLPLRFLNLSNLAFSELCRDTRSVCYTAAGHAQVPFDVILSELGLEALPATHHPLYQVQINYLQHHLAEVQVGDLTLRERNATGVNISYDLCVSILENPSGGARITFAAQEYLYGTSILQRLGAQYLTLLDLFLADSSRRVDVVKI